MEMLSSIGINQKNQICIKSLYWNKSARVNVDGELTDEFVISKGGTQGCLLWPLLFFIYSPTIFEDI